MNRTFFPSQRNYVKLVAAPARLKEQEDLKNQYDQLVYENKQIGKKHALQNKEQRLAGDSLKMLADMQKAMGLGLVPLDTSVDDYFDKDTRRMEENLVTQNWKKIGYLAKKRNKGLMEMLENDDSVDFALRQKSTLPPLPDKAVDLVKEFL